MQNPNLVVGISSKMPVFKEALVEWNVQRWEDVKWTRNENKKMQGKCRRDGCNCSIYASPMQGQTTL